MEKYGKWSEQQDTRFRTSGDNKELILTPPSTLTGASLTHTLPDVAGTTDTLVSLTSTATLTNKTLTAPVISTIVNTGTLTLPTTTDTLVGRATTDTLTNKTIDGDDNTVQDLALTTLKTTANLNVFLQRNGSGVVIDSAKSVPAGDVVGNSDTQTLTNKTIDADTNTITNIENADIKAGANIALSKLAALTASRATETNISGEIVASTVTSTELGYLTGVTSSIQTQLDAKQADVITTQGDIIIGNVSGDAVRLGIGAVGTVVTSNGTTASWQAPAGTGDVSAAANIADNALVRGDGGAKGIQQSGITVDDSDNITGVESITAYQAVLLKATVNNMTLASGETTIHPLLTVSTGDVYTVDSGADFYSIDTVTVDGTFTINGNATVLH